MPSKKIARISSICVACGCCVKVCPLSALSIWKGVMAQVDGSRCVGCGRCAQECPAGAIDVLPREEAGA